MRVSILALLCFDACALFTPVCEKLEPSGDAHFMKKRKDGLQQPESIAEKFEITLCKESDIHGFKTTDGTSFDTGTFRVRKLKGCLGESQPKMFSADEEYMKKVQEEMGQDEFIFVLEGPEVHSLHPTPSPQNKRCEYELPFALTTPGKYHVNLVWVRENYLAADETKKVWPAAHYDVPLGTGVFVTLGDNGKMGLEMHKKLHEDEKKTLPTCDMKDNSFFQMESRWVYQGNANEMFFEKPKNVRCVDTGYLTNMRACNPDNVVKTHIDYKKYDYLPYDCQPRRFTAEEAKTCLKDKKVDFRGDSHLRLLFWTLSQWVYGHGSVDLLEKQKFQVSRGNKNLTHTPLMDKVEKMVPPENLKEYDVVVTGFGHHPADGRHHMALAEFQKLVDQYADKVDEQGEEAKDKMVWLEIPALPLRMDKAVISFTDWRTDHRFRLYNEYANDKFESIGVPVMKAYDATQGMSLHAYENKDGYDLWHYPAEVYMPFIQDVLGKIC